MPTRDQMIRGANGPYRANNDLLYYHLNIRVDPKAETVSGVNTIRFRMLKDGNRIQIDLQQPLAVDKILFGNATLKYDRLERAVFIDFPQMLHEGQTYSIDFYYSGHPVHQGRFGDFTFGKDPDGNAWVYTADEGEGGASTWWPSKEEWRDKPQEGMDISVAVPNGLTDVSNGKFAGKVDLHDGYTQWNWKVQNPINSYDVSVNIGNYVHFSDKWGNYYVLPQDLEKARSQFKQVGGMMEAYQHYFGEYPFASDGYKLVEVPYSGMEHQSAVTYGNGFKNGYLGMDWGGTPYALKFDFIIIHESGHEWFANGVTASDLADMWIHEGFTTYLESLYVEYHWGKAASLEYVNGYQSKVENLRPIIPEYGVGAEAPEDQYFKGALMLNTLRSVVNDDQRWWDVLHGLFQHFKYQSISTSDVVTYFNQHTGMDLTPIFDQYLRYPHIPTLDLLFGESPGMVMYKWNANVDNFAMPVRVGEPGHWQIIHPTTRWQWMNTPLTKDQFKVATDLYYINVDKQ
ncbi:M1 family peptidase [Dyella monticola]|uniref:M1 family peptidase n=2 Tax=Dyella monticola TaxID=1927958 RepID=A0A370X649_9GAMM|nr:M1 family peptidase [Dyella monticola]